MRRLSFASLLVLGGCALFEQLSPDAAPAGTGGSDTCDLAAIASSPSLVGMGKEDRAKLTDAAVRGIAVVHYTVQDCQVRFEVLDGCHASGRYVYDHDFAEGTIEAKNSKELIRALPIAAGRLDDAVRANPVRFEWQRGGRLRAPQNVRLERVSLKGDDCERATHVATQITLGAYQEMSAKKPSTEAEVGSKKACQKASRRKRRVKRCDQPLGVDLVPVTNEAIDDAPVEVVAGRVKIEKSSIEVPAFEIDRYEVTAAQYGACVAAGACTAAGQGPMCTAGVLQKSDHPINCVTWAQADAYCQFAGRRLPTEAEWERAARGDDGQVFPWGKEWPPPEGAANFSDRNTFQKTPHWETIEGYVDGFSTTSPVVAFAGFAAPSGMADAAGNVLEWTADWHDSKKQARVVRSSSFGHARREDIELSRRNFYVPETVSIHIGFRCAGDLAAKAPKPE